MTLYIQQHEGKATIHSTNPTDSPAARVIQVPDGEDLVVFLNALPALGNIMRQAAVGLIEIRIGGAQ